MATQNNALDYFISSQNNFFKKRKEKKIEVEGKTKNSDDSSDKIPDRLWENPAKDEFSIPLIINMQNLRKIITKSTSKKFLISFLISALPDEV